MYRSVTDHTVDAPRRCPSFDQLYGRPTFGYGMRPTPLVAAAARCVPAGGTALDLGAGAGRDSMELARQGLKVTAIDQSARGIARLRDSARQAGVERSIDAHVADVCDLAWRERLYDLIVAITLLDHLDHVRLRRVWDAMCCSLRPSGLLCVEVHTTDDPGAHSRQGRDCRAPISETAGHVRHYFQPGELQDMAMASLKVLKYEERTEWDQTHGRPHQHAKASLLASGP